MSEFVSTHLPCPCGTSSDAFSLNTEGNGFCFSCSKFFRYSDESSSSNRYNDQPMQEEDKSKYTYQFIDYRGIKASTYQKYNARFKVNSDGEPVAAAFPFHANGRQIRLLTEKRFISEGDMSIPSLMGMEVFPPGSAEAIIIHEGLFDAPSGYQMTGLPAVSVRSSSSAFKDCAANLEYLNSFPKIYLALDNDAPGREATKKIAPLFDSDKVYDIKFTSHYKDANDILRDGKEKDFRNMVEFARRFIPTEIVSSFAEIDRILAEEQEQGIVTYPFPTWQEMTYGIREGITLITALEGQGKTEIIRAIETHILRTTDLNLGIIHLEESKARSIKGFAGYQLGQPVHLPDVSIPQGKIAEAYRQLAGRDERIHHINHFDDDDPHRALDLIRFLVVKCGCRVVFLDHISFLVTGLEDSDERKKLDYISTRLEKMTGELHFVLIMVSHVNDEGLTRGSRNISKVANVRIDLTRDHLNEDSVERNRTYTTISKNRDGARTGPSGVLTFDPETFIITEWNPQDDFIPGN